MSDFKAKMHQIRFWLGLRSRPCRRSLKRPRPLTGLRVLLLREGRGLGRGEGKGKGWGGEGKGREW